MRIKSLFYKKIFCFHCQSGCKKKKERSTVKYLCSNYDNFGTCQRNLIKEDKIIKAINRRYGRELTEEEIGEVVVKIIVKNDKLFDIILIEGRPISYHEKGIIF